MDALFTIPGICLVASSLPASVEWTGIMSVSQRVEKKPDCLHPHFVHVHSGWQGCPEKAPSASSVESLLRFASTHLGMDEAPLLGHISNSAESFVMGIIKIMTSLSSSSSHLPLLACNCSPSAALLTGLPPEQFLKYRHEASKILCKGT